jgi:hypothetical protein
LNHLPISEFVPIYGVDSKNGDINLFKDRWLKPPPARACESTGQTIDICQVIKSLSGMTASVGFADLGLSPGLVRPRLPVTSRTENGPHSYLPIIVEVWTVTLAGLTRTVCMLNIMILTYMYMMLTSGLHPSQHFFLAAGRHIKATDMIWPVVKQLIRSQRRIQAFDATTGQKREPFPRGR